jgi:predicted secreted Zn-dependent protease
MMRRTVSDSTMRFRERVGGGRALGGLAAVFLLASATPMQAQSADPQGVPPGMTTTAEEVRYEVFGTTPTELRQSMRDRGPLEQGRRWDGYTNWRVGWTYRYAMRSGTCEITEVEVAYSSRVVLPEWRAPSGTSVDLRRDWNRYLAALRTHEEGHVRIGADAAREILAGIGALTAPSCTDMSARADRLGHRTLDEFRARQRAYDAETGHGRTQGAVWPPPRAESR